MVALADWYILPILPPIGETFRPFKYQRRGPHAFGCVQDFTPASWTFGSTRMYGFEYAVRGIQVGLQLQYISMDYCILLGCVIVGLQVQPICMTMSILTSWWKLKWQNSMRLDKELYTNIRIGVYSKTVKVTGAMKIPVMKLMILFLYSCPDGPSCVVGDVETTPWSHSYLPWIRGTQCWGLRLGNLDYTL